MTTEQQQPPPPALELGAVLQSQLQAFFKRTVKDHATRQKHRLELQLGSAASSFQSTSLSSSSSSSSRLPPPSLSPSALNYRIASLKAEAGYLESTSDLGSLSLLRAHAQAGDVVSLLSVFKFRRSRSYPPVRTDPSITGTRLSCAHDDYLIVLRGLTHARATGKSSWYIVYNRIDSVCHSLLRDMKSFGKPIDEETLCGILGAYSRAATVPATFEHKSSSTSSSSSGGEGIGGNPGKLEAARIVSSALSLLSDARDGNLYGHKPVAITTKLVNRVLQISCRSNELERAFDILYMFFIEKTVPTMSGGDGDRQFKGGLSSSSSSSSSPPPRHNSLSPDAVTFNTLLNGFARRGDVRSCLDVIAAMSSNGVTADSVTVEALVLAAMQSYYSYDDDKKSQQGGGGGGMGGVGGAISAVQSCWNQYNVLPRPTILYEVLEMSLAKGEVYEAKRCVFLLRQIVGTVPPAVTQVEQSLGGVEHKKRGEVLFKSLRMYRKDERFSKEAIKALFAKYNFSTDKM